MFIRRSYSVFFAVFVVSLAACSESIVRRHPSAANIPPDSELTHVLRRTRETNGVQSLEELAARLDSVRRSSSLGVPQGESNLMFGRIEDVTVDPAGRLLVLDSRHNEVRVFGPAGTFIEAWGRPGTGAGSFRSPAMLAVGPKGEVIVADRGNNLKLFQWFSSSYVFRSAIHVPFVPEDLCLLKDALYVRGWTPQNLTINQYTKDGALVRSFGTGYQDDQRLVREQLSDGLIACSDDESVIVAMFEHLPFIYAYSSGGEPLWVSKIDDFRSITITSTTTPDGKNRVTLDARAEFDYASSLLLGPGGTFVLQTTRMRVEDVEKKEISTIVRTYLIEARTGIGTYVNDALPLLREIHLQRVIAVEQEPFPRVVIYDF